MASYLLLSSVQLRSTFLWPGTTVSDVADDIPGIRAAAGAGVLWSTSDAAVAAAAALAVSARQSGRPVEECASIMQAGVAGSLAATAAAATAAAASAPALGTITVAFADFAALGVGVKTKDYTLVLPTNARLSGLPIAEGFTGFDDATHGTMAATLGTSAGGNQLGTSLNLAAGQTGFPKAMAAGASAILNTSLSAATLTLRFTSGVDLNTLTAGAVTIRVPYVILP